MNDERAAAERQERRATTRYGFRLRQDATVNADEQPRYVISIAAQILGVHPQTLRLYERAHRLPRLQAPPIDGDAFAAWLASSSGPLPSRR